MLMQDSSKNLIFSPNCTTFSMEFMTSRHDYSVADFYNLFHDRLPVVVMVTQGFYGDIVEDTFDRGEVLTINSVSRQKRIVAHLTLFRQSKVISIPEDYEEQLCIVRNGNIEKEDRLDRIIRNNSLPVLVQFPRNKVLTVGNKSVSTSHIPPLELKKRFEEFYLLGHDLVKGEITPDIVHVPLYLSELRLSPVTGIAGSPLEKWKMFLDHLRRRCSSIKYNQYFGNPNIAEYDPNAIHDNTRFSHVQPKSYSSIVGLINGQPLRNRPRAFFPAEQGYSRQDTENKLFHQTRRSQPLPPQPPTERTSQQSGLRHGLRYNPNDTDLLYITPVAPYLSQIHESADAMPIARKSPEPDYDFDSTPSVPDRTPIAIRKDPEKHQYENNPHNTHKFPRTYISPVRQHLQKSSHEQVLAPSQDEAIKSKTDTCLSKTVKNMHELSIHEVCEYLKTLNLGQYSQRFRENMIDGSMLVDLTEPMLREEFGLSRVETFRLLKFAKEGYIPS